MGMREEGDDDGDGLSGSLVSSSIDSMDSVGSSSSSDVTDDATSSPPSSPPPPPPATSPPCRPQPELDGPLYELSSSLMAQLPIKRGLSRFFSGKSQSFTSLANVRCVEDLAKKEAPCRRRIKPCKSFGGMSDLGSRSYFAPGPCGKTISKKSSRGSCASLATKRSNSGLFGGCKPPPVPVQRNM